MSFVPIDLSPIPSGNAILPTLVKYIDSYSRTREYHTAYDIFLMSHMLNFSDDLSNEYIHQIVFKLLESACYVSNPSIIESILRLVLQLQASSVECTQVFPRWKTLYTLWTSLSNSSEGNTLMKVVIQYLSQFQFTFFLTMSFDFFSI